MSLALILITSIILGALRIGGEKGEFFQAAAHIWVGGSVRPGHTPQPLRPVDCNRAFRAGAGLLPGAI